LGAQPPTAEWGAMLQIQDIISLADIGGLQRFPGIAILLSVLGFNLLGDGLRDAIDPRLRQKF